MSTEFERILIFTHKEERERIMLTHPEYIDEAVELTLANRHPFSWRAAWVLNKYMEENDQRVKPYIDRLIQCLDTSFDGYQRELLKVLLRVELNEEQEGYLYTICETIWKQVNKQPAVRFYAIKHILKIAGNHPDLLQEARLLLENRYLDSLTPGVRKSLNKILIGPNPAKIQ